jgi:hypothetical protein
VSPFFHFVKNGGTTLSDFPQGLARLMAVIKGVFAALGRF